jgi:hypothetical protein
MDLLCRVVISSNASSPINKLILEKLEKIQFLPGILTEGGRLSTIDLLIKVACFVKKHQQYLQYQKELI